MCGIHAIFSPHKPVDKNLLAAGVEVLHHRGPEHQGIWIADNQQVGLGHSRLSIIDLNTGEQPISDFSDNYHIVANGEFYDHENIRRDLEKKNYEFKTLSDSEIALHLYREYGAGCMRYLRGEFAFCIWDETNRILFAARDRFGIKPLFYTEHEGTTYIASEIKALIAAGVPAEWDTDSYFTRAFAYRDRTLFKNIHQVPPGHYLILTESGARTVKYWDFNYPIKEDYRPLSIKQAVEDVRDKIVDAIRIRLRADVPVGVYLSGGIDSSAVLGIASELHTGSIDAFTLAFEHEEYNELRVAEATAKHIGSNFNPIPVAQADLADNFADAIWHCETTCINAHGVAKYLLSKAVHKAGYKVVLTGEGADEIFAGYPPFRQDNITYNQSYEPEAIEQLLTQNSVSAGLLLENSDKFDPTIEQLTKIFGFIPSWLLPQASMIKKFNSLYRDDANPLSSALKPILQFINHLDISDQTWGRDPVHTSMYLMSKSLLPNYILTVLGDRMEMAHSVEGRVPFLDHQLVDYVTKLPVNTKIKGTTEKYILREATKPWLTDEVYERQKHPFLAPPSILKPKEKLYQLALDTFSSQAASALPFYDMEKVRKFMISASSSDAKTQISAEPIIMEILSLCVLQNKYAIEK